MIAKQLQNDDIYYEIPQSNISTSDATFKVPYKWMNILLIIIIIVTININIVINTNVAKYNLVNDYEVQFTKEGHCRSRRSWNEFDKPDEQRQRLWPRQGLWSCKTLNLVKVLAVSAEAGASWTLHHKEPPGI